jgi:predicted  nucleic acid-binding Zn-ribbon protein
LQEMIANLIMLQSIDTKLAEIEMLRGDLPKVVENLRTELNELREEITSDRQSVVNFNQEKSDLANEQTLNSEKLKKFQDQLYKSTSNKEYEATSAQIEFCEQENSRIKLRVIEIDSKVMELEEGLKPKEEKLAALEINFGEHDNELKLKISETSKEEDALKLKRDAVIPLLRKDLVNKYERIRKAKNGLAVAGVKKESCGGCFNQIPAQIIIELRKKDAIRTCEYCGRIIYLEANEIEEPESVSKG